MEEAKEEAKVVSEKRHNSDVLFFEDMQQSLADVEQAVFLTLQRATALDVVYRQEVEALTNGVLDAYSEIDEDELKIILFNLCREIKAIFNVFARPAFA